MKKIRTYAVKVKVYEGSKEEQMLLLYHREEPLEIVLEHIGIDVFLELAIGGMVNSETKKIEITITQ